jgi:putative phage-type endonuclease
MGVQSPSTLATHPTPVNTEGVWSVHLDIISNIEYFNSSRIEEYNMARDRNDVVNIPNIHPRVVELYSRPFFKQGTKLWLEQRKGFLTASDVGAVLGNCIFKNKKTVLGQKTGTISPEFQTVAMKHGTDTEPEAREIYEQLTGNKVIQFGLLSGSESCHFLAASVDGITTDGIVVEIKCPYSREIKQGQIPEYYQDQIQTQLEVVGLDTAHYFEYSSSTGETNLVVVKRNKDWMNIQTRRKLWDFWKKVEFFRKTITERNKTYQPYPVSQEELAKNPNSFFAGTYMMEYAKATMFDNLGDSIEECNTLINLANTCTNQGLGFFNLAEDTFILAEKVCQKNNMSYELSLSVVLRSKLYNSIGMKWYGIPLTILALSWARNYSKSAPNHVDNLFHIAYTEIILAESFLNWESANPSTEEKHMNSVRALYWTSQAITTIQVHSLDLELEKNLTDFYNQFGATLGWDKANVLFNDPKFQHLMNNKGSY